MIPELTATRFSKVMSSGRTQPCLMVCEDEAGGEVEVVVKLRKHPQILPGGFVAEAMASFLARDLGLPIQQPYRVRISKEFAQTVPDAGLRTVVEQSEGLNFACAKWGPGYTIWLRDQSLPKAMKRTAMEILPSTGWSRTRIGRTGTRIACFWVTSSCFTTTKLRFRTSSSSSLSRRGNRAAWIS